jgi:hypothetical protein
MRSACHQLLIANNSWFKPQVLSLDVCYRLLMRGLLKLFGILIHELQADRAVFMIFSGSCPFSDFGLNHHWF